MNAVLTGILTDKFPTETFQSGFAKRVFWLKQPDTERYPQHWEVELHGPDVTRINAHEIGDTLEVHVEIRGKKWVKAGKTSIFVTLKCTGLREIEALVPKQAKRRGTSYGSSSAFDLPFE